MRLQALDPQRWILADFGIAKVETALTSTFTTGATNTPAWSSPEHLDGGHQGEPSDVWSFGVLAWEVMTRQQPWAGKSTTEIIAAVKFREERLPLPGLAPASSLRASVLGQGPFYKDKAHISTQRGLNKLVGKCWHAKPAKRVCFLEILRTLEDLAKSCPLPHPS
jgi:serine/threonine protein kinase